MKKQTAYIFIAIVIVLMMIAGVILWLTGDIGGSDRPETTASPAEESAPAVPDETPSPTPSAAPSASPKPTPTPEPAPVQPSGETVGSGSFDSDTGVGLNTHTVWTVTRASDGGYELSLSVYARSYTLGIGQRSITISVGGSASTALTRAFDVDSPNSQTETLIYTGTVPVDAGSVSVSIDWNYKGQYSGQDLDVISSQTTVQVG